MKSSLSHRLLAFVAFLLLTFALIHPQEASAAHDHLDHPSAEIPASPLAFVQNQGQWENFVQYRAEVPGGWVWFEDNRLTYQMIDLTGLHDDYFHSQQQKRGDGIVLPAHVFRMELVGANKLTGRGNAEKTTYHNYFQGNDPTKWATKVPLFGEIRYDDVWAGIDLVYYAQEKGLKYDFVVAPGANTASIVLQYDGLHTLRTDVTGQLHMETSVGEIVEMQPYAYQLNEQGKRIQITCQFEVEGDQVRFGLGKYDPSRELIIDPTLIFGSYTGSTADNFGFTACYDDLGNLYGGGIAFGAGYPTTTGAFQIIYGGGNPNSPFGSGFDMSISCFNPTGTALVYSTYIGGSDNEQPQSLITAPNGDLVIYGRTSSSNYPIAANAFQSTIAGQADIVVTRLDPTGTSLIGSTYIGGSANDGLNIQTVFSQNSLYFNYGDDARGEVMVDAAGNVYIASQTQSSNFPITPGAFSTTFQGGLQDACVFRMSPNLSALTWSTYLGGSGNDAAYSIKLDSQGNAFISGGTESNDFPTTPATISPAYNGAIDGYIAKIDPSGGNLLAGTYIGTNAYDQSYFLEIDLSDAIYVVGQTRGAFPVSPNVYSNPGSSQFILKTDNDLSATTFSTVFGSGSQAVNISPTAFLVDRCGYIYVCGWGGAVNFQGTTSNMPVTNNAFQSTTDGSDIYLMVLEPDAAALEYATYFGGSTSDEHVDGGTSRFNPDLEVYHAVCAGCGGNSDFPTTPGAVSNTNNSFNCNLGVFKFAFDPTDVQASYSSQQLSGCAPFPVLFNNNSAGGVTYIWDYGDGLRDTTVQDTHIYQNPGTYTVMLIAIDSNSCNVSDTVVTQITVNGSPLGSVTVGGGGCNLDTIQLTATGGQIYDWSPGTFLSDSTIPNPLAFPPNNTVYTLIISDTNGCTDTIQVPVNTGDFTVDAGPPVSFCAGQGGAQLQAVSLIGGTAPYYYEWWCDSTNTFCGLDSTFDNGPIALPTVTTTYYVQVTDANGCVTPIDSVVVTVLPVPIADAGPDREICQPNAPGAILNGSFSGAPGPFDYFWTPSTGLNDSTILNPYARPDTTTIYTLIGVSSNGCSSFPTTLDTLSTVTVTVNPRPIADAGPDLDICFGDTSVLTGLGFGAGPDYQFEWSPFTGLSDSTIPSPQVSPDLTTIYTLVVWSNGCPSFGDSVTVNVHTLPTPSAGNVVEICLGDSAQLDAFADGDSTASYTYQWSPGLALNDSTIEAPLASPDTSTWYYLIATSNFGCRSPLDSVLVQVKPTPIAEAGPDLFICFGDSILLEGEETYTTTAPAPANDVYYEWFPAASLSDSSILQPMASPGVSTIYYLEIRHNTCVTRDSMLLEVNPNIGAALTADTTVICGGDSVPLFAEGGLGNVLYDWSPVVGLNNPASGNPIAAPDETTTYQVILTQGGCFDTADVTIEVIPSPVAAMLSSVREGCAPLTVNFLSNSSDVINYVWNFGDGSPVLNESNVTHSYPEGTYFASFTAINAGGCADTVDSIRIQVDALPIAGFASDPMYPAEIAVPGGTVTFENLSQHASEYVWNFGDGTSSTVFGPSHDFTRPGEYFVTLQVASPSGCTDEVTHGPYVVVTPDLFIPNVFSPNDDGLNDGFRIEYAGSQPVTVQIYDRWGVQMFESTDKNQPWDGSASAAENAPEGTYYYRVQIGEREFAGDVTLVR